MAVSRRSLLRAAGAAGLVGCDAGGRPGTGGGASADDGLDPSEVTLGGTPSLSSSGPNILYIFLDQLRWDHLGVMGHPVVQTPNLDALASSASLFEGCVTNAPQCMPSRAVMMSGRYPSRSGVLTNYDAIDEYGPSHVRRLRDEAGYHTGVVGKVHLHQGRGHKDDWLWRMEELGFSQAVELSGVRLAAVEPNLWSDWLSGRTRDGEEDRYRRFQRYVRLYEQNANAQAEWAAIPWDDPRFAFEPEEHIDHWIGTTSADWITAMRDAARPWYLQVNLTGPHPPWDAPSATLDRYDLYDPALPLPEDRMPGQPWSPLVRMLHRAWTAPATELERRQTLVHYYARITMVDEIVGRVLDALEASGQSDDTWVIIGADHGEQLGDKNLIGKLVFFDGSIRTPLLLRPPGGVVPRVHAGWCDQRDVTATLLDLAGLTHELAGARSLRGAVLDGRFEPKEAVVSEVQHFSMILDERFKLVVDRRGWVPVELDDRAVDPGEWNNLVADPDQDTRRVLLVDRLREILERSE